MKLFYLVYLLYMCCANTSRRYLPGSKPPNVYNLVITYDCGHVRPILESSLNLGVDAYGNNHFCVDKYAFEALEGGALTSPQSLEDFVQAQVDEGCTINVKSMEERYSEVPPSRVTAKTIEEVLVKDGYEWYVEHRRRLEALPESVDYRPTMMPARNQGAFGACVAFASTAVFEWHQNQQNTGEDQYFSPLFLYRHRCVGNTGYCYEDAGMPYDRAFDTMINVGMIPEDDMPWALATPYDSFEEVEARHFEQAQMTRLHQAMFILQDYSYPEDITDEEKTEHLKTMLVEFGPGVVSFWNWEVAEDDASPTGARVYFMEECCGIEGHAVVAAGYDTYGVIIRNSWGDRWSDNGYIHLPWTEIWKGIGDIHFVTDRNLQDDEIYGTDYRCEHPNLDDTIYLQNKEGTEEEVCMKKENNVWNPTGDNSLYPGCQDCKCCHKLSPEEVQGNEKDNYKECYKDDSLLTMGRAFHHTLGGEECSGSSCTETDKKFLICRGDDCAASEITSRQSCQSQVDQLIDEGKCHPQGVFYTNLCEASQVQTSECGCLRPGQRRVFVKDMDYIGVFQIKTRCTFYGNCPIWGDDYCPNSNWCYTSGSSVNCEGGWGCCGEHERQSYQVEVPPAGPAAVPCEFRHGDTQSCVYDPEDACHTVGVRHPTNAPTVTQDKFGEDCTNYYDLNPDGSKSRCVDTTKEGNSCAECGLHDGRPQRCCAKRSSDWRFSDNLHCADAIFHESALENQYRCVIMPDEPYYHMIKSGTCEEDMIEDRGQCLHASNHLKLGYSSVTGDSRESQAANQPYGCFEYQEKSKLYIRNGESEIECSESQPCICKGPGCFHENCTKAPSKDPTVKPDPTERPVYHAPGCGYSAVKLDWDYGEYTVICSSQCERFMVWGCPSTEPVTDDSDFCKAAAMVGIEVGVEFTVTVVPGGSSHMSCTLNGISSLSFGSWGRGMTIQEKSISASTSEPSLKPTTVPSIQPSAEPSIQPSSEPTGDPSIKPVLDPTNEPSSDVEITIPGLVCDTVKESHTWDPLDTLAGSNIGSWEECAKLCEESTSCMGATLEPDGNCWLSGPASTLVKASPGCQDEDTWETDYFCSHTYYNMFLHPPYGCALLAENGYCRDHFWVNCCKRTCETCGDDLPTAVECAPKQDLVSVAAEDSEFIIGRTSTSLVIKLFALVGVFSIAFFSCQFVNHRKINYMIAKQEEET